MRNSVTFIEKERERILSLSIHNTIKTRAINGLDLLKHYGQLHCWPDDDVEIEQDYTISDMIADILHYADTRPDCQQYDLTINAAIRHFEAECGDGDDIEQDTRRYEEKRHGSM
jgi:hypothetical protein